MLETWTQASGGALHEEPLLLRVNRAGAFGSAETYPGGSVRQALFTYLCGAPNPALFAARPELFFGKWLVCMSAEWAAFVREKPLETTMRRIMMQPRLGASLKALKPLPSGYRISGFTPEIFAAHPFGQGQNYPDFADFARLGAGAAVLCGDKIVAAAKRHALRMVRRQIGRVAVAEVNSMRSIFRPYYVAFYGKYEMGKRIRYLPIEADGHKVERVL